MTICEVPHARPSAPNNEPARLWAQGGPSSLRFVSREVAKHTAHGGGFMFMRECAIGVR
jgi:hypothetical protein